MDGMVILNLVDDEFSYWLLVLDYTSKGFIQIIKTAIKLGKEKDENC